jgi:hypothetical protein
LGRRHLFQDPDCSRIAGSRRDAESGSAREHQRRFVRSQDVTDQVQNAQAPDAALQFAEQQAPDPLAAPVVRDRDRQFAISLACRLCSLSASRTADGWGDDSPPAQSGRPERDRSAAVLWK